MFNQKRYREREAERRKPELLLHTDSNRQEHQRPHILGLEHQSTEKHQTCKQKIKYYKRSLRCNTKSIHTRSYQHRRKICCVQTGTDDIRTGREDHQMPWNIYIIPFNDTDSRKQSDDSTDKHNDLC